MTRLTAPLAQIALRSGRPNVVDMPPSTYRPSPPSTRGVPPPHALEPDRQLVEGYQPPKREITPRSVPEPRKGPPEMAGKKRKRQANAADETKAAAVARVKALVSGGESREDALGKVAKELGYAPGSLNRWMVQVNKASDDSVSAPSSKAVVLNGLDLILDIIELCERAKKGLTKSQRARLKAALNERLS